MAQPNLIPRPFAALGTAANIPDAKVNFGEASWQEGFPTETGLPLAAGGIPPRKTDFNGVLRSLSEHICYLQEGGAGYAWHNTADYDNGALAIGSDGALYVAIQPSGPSAAVHDPTAAGSSAFWLNLSVPGAAVSADKLTTARAIDGVNFDGTADIVHYGTCSTAAATAAKTVALTDFVLVIGARVTVKFTNTNTATNPTLNVNATGAKAIYHNGVAIATDMLSANCMYTFVYDGTNYVLSSASKASADTLNTARTIDGVNFDGSANIHHYGTCSTAAGTVAKVVALPGFVLATGAVVTVQFTVTNTANNPTLNVNSTGAKAIYHNGAAIDAGAISAGRVYSFVYDGTRYQLVDAPYKSGGGGTAGYEICEFYYFRHPTARPGFVPAYGTLISNASITYPDAWAYLQTADGQLLRKTEAQWQSMHNAAPWSGVGGVPFFVIDTGAGTIRVPDIRGMYPEAAGFDSLNVGGVNGPGLPNITGRIGYRGITGQSVPTQAFYLGDSSSGNYNMAQTGSVDAHFATMDASRFNSIYGASTTVRPRSFGVLPCVYLGA